MVALVAGWTKQQWAVILAPCLTGVAQLVRDTLVLEEAEDYDKVKGIILGSLSISMETYRRRLREVKLEKEQPQTHG